MGNILCKNRVNHSNNNPKSPVDRVIGRCAQICPKSLGKQKHFWDKQVLETSPPQQTQPQSDNSGYNSASLTVPDSPQGDGIEQPVAPPRKKRPSMIRKDDPPIRNGFKEIFVGNRSESTTTSDSQGDAKDFTDFEKVPLNRGTEMEKEKELAKEREIERMEKTNSTRSSAERSDQSETKSNTSGHVVPKVGNKKSDKFFGENLSDCLSDEPMVDQEDAEIAKIKEQMVQADSTTKAAKKYEEAEEAIKEQLLASLTTFKDIKQEESIDEPDRVAVEEPIITKVIITRHICDDEEELRARLHNEHDHTYVVPDPNAPKKPQRDFARYKKNQDEGKADKDDDLSAPETESDLLTQIQKELPALSQILSPKPKDSAQETGKSEVQEVIVKTERHKSPLDRPSESLPEKVPQGEQVLRQQSYLTPDLVDQITQQVGMADHYLPEDYSSSKDGSEISPNSKLVQKRSYGSQTTYVENQKDQTVPETKAAKEQMEKTTSPALIQNIEVNPEESVQTIHINEPETPPASYKLTITTPMFPDNKEVPAATTTEKQPDVKKRNPQEMQVKAQIFRELANENISKTIKSFMENDDLKPQDILKLLEEEFGELLNSSTLSAEDQQLIEDLRNTIHANDKKVEIDSAMPSSEPAVTFADHIVSEVIEGPKEIIQVASENISREENDSDSESKISTATAISSTTPKAISDEKRRHSIDEFDHWFAGGITKKIELPQRKRKRESSLPGYLITHRDDTGHSLDVNAGTMDDSELNDNDDIETEPHRTVITTTAIHIFDPIPEGGLPMQTVQEKMEEVIIPLNSSYDTEQPEVITEVVIKEITNAQPEQIETTEKTETTLQDIIEEVKTRSKDESSRPIVRGEKNRSSVGHSLLLKFLAIERSNSFK